MAEAAKVRGATGFMMWCQCVAGLNTQASGNPALTSARLARHVRGETLGGTAKDVLIVGAGPIGRQLANELALAGHRLTLPDVMAEPLARWQAEAAVICDREPAPCEAKPAVVRVKATSHPMTLH